jgi:hypothetical protein
LIHGRQEKVNHHACREEQSVVWEGEWVELSDATRHAAEKHDGQLEIYQAMVLLEWRFLKNELQLEVGQSAVRSE